MLQLSHCLPYYFSKYPQLNHILVDESCTAVHDYRENRESLTYITIKWTHALHQSKLSVKIPIRGCRCIPVVWSFCLGWDVLELFCYGLKAFTDCRPFHSHREWREAVAGSCECCHQKKAHNREDEFDELFWATSRGKYRRRGLGLIIRGRRGRRSVNGSWTSSPRRVSFPCHSCHRVV